MKKTAALLLAILQIFICGCAAPEVTEPGDRLIIQAIGIDLTDDGFEISVQALNSNAAGGNGSDTSQSMTQTCFFYGETVGEAFGKANSMTGLYPLYSQTRVLIIGHDAAMKKFNEAIDFFLREYTARAEVLIAVAQNSAKEVVAAPLNQDRPGAAVIAEAIRSGKNTGECATVEFYEFINLYLSESDAAYCPVISVRKNEKNNEYNIDINGTAIFESTKIGTVITKAETTGLLTAANKIKKAGITAETTDGIFTLRAVKNKTKIKLSRENGKYHFYITSVMLCDITEFSTAEISGIGAKNAQMAAEAASRKLMNSVSDTIKKCFFENNCDICRFGKRVSLKYPNGDKPTPDNVICTVTNKVIIRRTGKEVLAYPAT